MPNNKLILRSVNSPWVSPFNDITTGSVLSWADVDNNFIYLKGELIHSGYTNNNQLILQKINGSTINLNLPQVQGDDTRNRWYVPSDVIVEVPSDYQSFIYGDLYVEGLIKLNDNSQLVVLNGDIILSGGSISGNGTTISVELPMVDTRIIGGNYSGDTLTIFDNTGGTFNVSGFYTGSTDVFVTGGTYNDGVLTLLNNTGGTISINGLFTGNTLESCINDLYVSNIHSCSPLYINPNDEGNVYFGSTSGVTIDVSIGEISANNLKVNTFSATTYLNLPSDIYVTGGTYNSITESIDFSGTTSFPNFSVNVSELLDDTNTYVTGGTFSTGTLTLDRNDGNSISVTGFTSDNFYTTGATLNGNTLQFNRNDLNNAYSVDLSSLNSSVNVGNVIYVDKINGNNLTGVINDFTKPFSTLAAALNYTDTLTPTENNRLLIYIRRGQYNNEGQMTFRNNVDIYCEQGVVFTGTFQLRTQFIVSSNFTGYAKFDVNHLSAWGTSGHFDIKHPSFINIEVDSMKCLGSTLFTSFDGLENLITFKANYVYSSGFLAGFGISLRNDSNVNVNIKKYESFYQLFSNQRTGGVIHINVDEGYLLEGDPYGYGGGFKQIFRWDFSRTPRGKTYITGNYINRVISNPTSIGTAGFRFWGSANAEVYFKGSIDAGETYPTVVMSDGSNQLTVEGELIGSRTCISTGGSNKLLLNNTKLIRKTDALDSPFSVGGSSEVYMNNSTYYSEFFGNLINIDTSSSKLYFNNVIAEGFVDLTGTTGTFINVDSNTPTIGINNVITNRDYNENITTDYLINLTVNPNVKAPKFY
jgi:hypothetical protein